MTQLRLDLTGCLAEAARFIARQPKPIPRPIPEYVSVSAMEAHVLDALASSPMTADEIAAVRGVPVTSIRPRLTGLKTKGKVELTGERRLTPAGRATGRAITAAVYRRANR